MMATVEDLMRSAQFVARQRQSATSSSASAAFAPSTTPLRNTLRSRRHRAPQAHLHLPVIADPSHACGHRELVPALARIGVAAGADGIIVEVHPEPEKAWSDGEQSLTFHEFDSMMAMLEPYIRLRTAAAVGTLLETAG